MSVKRTPKREPERPGRQATRQGRVPPGARLQFRMWQIATAVLTRVPARAGYAIATVAGTAGYYLWPRGRKAMHSNYRHVLPAASRDEIRRTAKRSLINYCCYLVDFIRFPSLTAAEVVAAVGAPERFADLDRALERGRGVVIICLHYGNWDLGAGATAARGFPLAVVAETFGDRRMDAMIVDARTRLGMSVLKMEHAGPSLVRTLLRNGLLALLIDRPVVGEGVKVNFFGSPVEVPAGPARLALRTGAAIVVTAFPRVAPGKLEVETLTDFEIVTPARGGGDDVVELTQKIMDVAERFVRKHPDQWYMFREMWPVTLAAGRRAS